MNDNNRLHRLWCTITDEWAFGVASLWIWLCPPPETPVDRAIRERGEQIRDAFPAIDFYQALR